MQLLGRLKGLADSCSSVSKKTVPRPKGAVRTRPNQKWYLRNTRQPRDPGGPEALPTEFGAAYQLAGAE